MALTPASRWSISPSSVIRSVGPLPLNNCSCSSDAGSIAAKPAGSRRAAGACSPAGVAARTGGEISGRSGAGPDGPDTPQPTIAARSPQNVA
jgi:hypothetical protein